MSPIPMCDLTRQVEALRPQIDEAVARVLGSTRFILGDEVTQFEQAMADYLEVGYCVGVASGTDALALAIGALDIPKGSRILTTPFTFFATASAMYNAGCEPVFADIDDDTLNIDPASVKEVLSGNHPTLARLEINVSDISALLPVHLYGCPADMGALEMLASDHELPLIEDNAQAQGAKYGDRMLGTLGDAGCFSFFPSKNLGAFGDGGLICTAYTEVAEVARALRGHGGTKRYHHDMLGTNSRLDALQAAILNVKLPHVSDWVEKRRAVAKAYSEGLRGVGDIRVPVEREGSYVAYHQYTLRTEKRDELAAHLKSRDIASAIYYPVPVHFQPALAHLGYTRGDFPNAERAAQEVLSLPIFPEMTPEEVDQILTAIREFY